MTYPVSPNDVGPARVRPDSGQFWASGVATAVVAALIALVGILICRWTLRIPILGIRSARPGPALRAAPGWRLPRRRAHPARRGHRAE
jgi:hypothetical protein